MGNCAFCDRFRAYLLKGLVGSNVRVSFTTGSGRGASRVEQFVERRGKWIITRQGQHHVKDVETIERNRP